MDFDDEIDDLLELEEEITGLAGPLSAVHKSLNLLHLNGPSVVQGRLQSVLVKMAPRAPVSCAAKNFARLMLLRPGTYGLVVLQAESEHAAMHGMSTTWSHQMISQT